jgi:hypothetical protein
MLGQSLGGLVTFEELDRKFPNAFVDAHVMSISVDFGKATVRLHLSLRGNLPESPDRDVYTSAVLVARGIYYVSIEPPDADHLLGPKREKITVDGHPEDLSKFPQYSRLKPRLATNAFVCRFFVHDWEFVYSYWRRGRRIQLVI